MADRAKTGSALVHGAEADRWGGWDWHSDETKEAIYRGSGLVFVFEDGRVRWRPYDYTAE